MRTVPANRASAMVGALTARISEQRGGRIRGIELCNARAVRKPGIPTAPSVATYMGQRYTRLEPEGCIGFRGIHPDDHDLFLLAVTDNLVNV